MSITESVRHWIPDPLLLFEQGIAVPYLVDVRILGAGRRVGLFCSWYKRRLSCKTTKRLTKAGHGKRDGLWGYMKAPVNGYNWVNSSAICLYSSMRNKHQWRETRVRLTDIMIIRYLSLNSPWTRLQPISCVLTPTIGPRKTKRDLECHGRMDRAERERE